MPATWRLYANGISMGVSGMNPNPSKRGEIIGWSPGAVRRHTRWLYSVDAPQLEAREEVGYALTLTLRDCPPDHNAWVLLRDHWLRRIRWSGATRWHWVVEWQRRGVPHLHVAVYYPSAAHVPFGSTTAPAEWALIGNWLDVAQEYGARAAAQHVDRISGPLGWLKYLSKHASRGVRHYQRNGKPEGWEKTGRLWGHGGDWPTIPPLEFSGSMAEFHRFRRLIRSWRIADARASGSRDRTLYARRMLACPDRRLSAVRGVSDWVPETVALRLLDVLA